VNKVLSCLKTVLATGFFLGYIPIAPATFGCVISVVLWYFLLPYKIIYCIVAVILFVLGIITSDHLSAQWGHDPRRIVIDEYASLLLPLFFTPKRLLPLLVTFVCFRVFDIVKPFPIRRLERLPGGWGIMLDDLLAAGYTTIIVIIIFYLGHPVL
jgi:phosphatidylglycerophosphatase A